MGWSTDENTTSAIYQAGLLMCCLYCYAPDYFGSGSCCYTNSCSPDYCLTYVEAAETTTTYTCSSGTKLNNSYCFKKN